MSFPDYCGLDPRFALFMEALTDMADLQRPKVNHPPLVQGFFDESGKYLDSTGVFVFAGVVGFKHSFKRIVDSWAERLSEEHITHTSMKEALDLRGPYSGMRGKRDGTQVRDKLLIDLATLIASANA